MRARRVQQCIFIPTPSLLSSAAHDGQPSLGYNDEKTSLKHNASTHCAVILLEGLVLVKVCQTVRCAHVHGALPRLCQIFSAASHHAVEPYPAACFAFFTLPPRQGKAPLICSSPAAPCCHFPHLGMRCCRFPLHNVVGFITNMSGVFKSMM